MIKKLLFFFPLFISMQSSAQIALKLLQMRPVGDLGMVFDKAITGELMYLDEFDENWRTRAGISSTSFNPRLDTFPVYAVMEDGNGTTVLEGYQVYHKYKMLKLFGGVDYAFLDRDPFFCYVGFDIVFGGIDQEYERAYKQLLDESFSGGKLMAGVGLRLGVEYMFTDNIGSFAEFTRNAYYVEEESFHSHNEIGIGVHYIF